MASNGVYGTNIGANVTNNDIEIYYSYSPTRNYDDVNKAKFEKLDDSLLEQSEAEINESEGKITNVAIEGLYNLKLPLEKFNRKGYYTVYIKPKEYKTKIVDVGVLSDYSDVKGVLLNLESDNASLNALLNENNSLVGYRIIYYVNKNGTSQKEDYYRIITSNNKCEPVVQNLSNVNQKAVRYRYNDNSSLSFLTVTPSVATTFNPNVAPYIGVSTQEIGIVNTKFEPVLIEIEMVEHDDETISTMLEGSQLRDLDNGLVTTFNNEGEIYAQHEHYTLKDEFTGKPVYEVKKNKEQSIDFSQTLTDKLD